MAQADLRPHWYQLDCKMPIIKHKPSFNDKVVKGMKLEDLIEQHPNADVDYVTKEYERINDVKKGKKDILETSKIGVIGE